MTIGFDDYLAKLPKKRQQTIKKRAAELIAEEATMRQLREAQEQSQAECGSLLIRTPRSLATPTAAVGVLPAPHHAGGGSSEEDCPGPAARPGAIGSAGNAWSIIRSWKSRRDRSGSRSVSTLMWARSR